MLRLAYAGPEECYTLELARSRARTAWSRYADYRYWYAEHGSGHAASTVTTPADPHSHAPDRDTAVRYGHRQRGGIIGHITSLKPTRPENAPDKWEAEALHAFERGQTEVSACVDMRNALYMRLMRPLTAEASCLKCHASQGYQVGQVCGGISVAIPMEPLLALARTQNRNLMARYAVVWLMVLAGIGVGTCAIRRQIHQRYHAEDQLREAESFAEQIVQGAAEGIVVYDRDLRYRVWNPFMERLTRVSAEQAIGQCAFDLFPHLRDQGVDRLLKRALAGEVVSSEDIPDAPPTSGNLAWLDRTYAPYYDASGRINGVIGIVRDVTERKQAQTTLQASERDFRSLIESAPEAIFVQSEGRFVYLNPPMLKLLGVRRPEDLLGQDFMKHVAPEFRESVRKRIQYQRMTGSPTAPMTMDYLRVDGTRVPVEVAAVVTRYQGCEAHLVFVRNINERRQAESALKESQVRFNQLAEQSRTVAWEVDTEGLYTYVSHVAETVWGYRPDELVGRKHFYDIHPDENREAFKTAALARFQRKDGFKDIENRIQRKDGKIIWVSTNGIPLFDQDNTLQGYRGADRDITERKRAEHDLIMAARMDRLTGLANRTLLLDRLQHAIQRHQRSRKSRYAVLFLDIDRFKNVNDSLGHDAGDQLVCEVARRLKEVVRAVDTVSRKTAGPTAARLGGDEFVILLDSLQSSQDACRVAERLLDVLSTPFRFGRHDIVSTASIGIVTSDHGYERAEDVLRDADTAMYEAKLAGRGRYVVFDVAMRQRVQNRLNVENDLRKAIDGRRAVPAVSADRLA